MIKHLFLALALSLFVHTVDAQISIVASDMAVAGDTLRHSMVNPATAGIVVTNTGANTVWNFSNLVPISQSVDSFRSATAVNFTYGLTISASAYGYKVADTLTTGSSTALPISVTDVYTFFNKKTSPSRFVAEAFAAKISSFPTPINYSDEDEVYFLPLNFNNHDSSTYKLSYNLLTLGSFSISGTRKTTVDGWGTIVTPHFTTPVSVIRVKSEQMEVDSVVFSGIPIGIPRHTFTYNWLATGEHDPVLTVVTQMVGNTETPITIRFHDHKRLGLLSVPGVNKTLSQNIAAYPNPATGMVTIAIPSGWNNYLVELVDVRGAVVKTVSNTSNIDISDLAAGLYIFRINHGENIAWGKLQVN